VDTVEPDVRSVASIARHIILGQSLDEAMTQTASMDAPNHPKLIPCRVHVRMAPFLSSPMQSARCAACRDEWLQL
jgi:hypothetical protein